MNFYLSKSFGYWRHVARSTVTQLSQPAILTQFAGGKMTLKDKGWGCAKYFGKGAIAGVREVPYVEECLAA